MMNLRILPGGPGRTGADPYPTRGPSRINICALERAPGTLISILLTTLVSWPTLCAAQEVIYRQDWDQVRSAVSVLQLPALQRAVSQYELTPNSNMVIRYPGGDDGSAWAVELRNWLVSLGVSLDVIELQPGSGVPQAISIEIEPHSAAHLNSSPD